MTKNLNFFNTLSNKKEKFVPINSDKVGMYVCGPTVYDFPHIEAFLQILAAFIGSSRLPLDTITLENSLMIGV